MARWILSAALRRTRVLVADNDVSSCNNNVCVDGSIVCMNKLHKLSVLWLEFGAPHPAPGSGLPQLDNRGLTPSHRLGS